MVSQLLNTHLIASNLGFVRLLLSRKIDYPSWWIGRLLSNGRNEYHIFFGASNLSYSRTVYLLLFAKRKAFFTERSKEKNVLCKRIFRFVHEHIKKTLSFCCLLILDSVDLSSLLLVKKIFENSPCSKKIILCLKQFFNFS